MAAATCRAGHAYPFREHHSLFVSDPLISYFPSFLPFGVQMNLFRQIYDYRWFYRCNMCFTCIDKSTITSLILNSASRAVTVDETELVNLTCQVDSNPGSTIRLMNGSKELTRTESSHTASHSWMAHCRQRGNYSCTASNSIGAAVDDIIKLAVKCSPRLDEKSTLQDTYTSSIGSNVTVSVPVLSYPVPTFTWSRTTSTSQNLTGSFIPVSDISITATLTLSHLQQKDFGDYNLTVENGVGETFVFTINLVPVGPPEMPTNVSVRSDDPYSLLVAWKQEFNGGAKQTFALDYSKDETEWIEAGEMEESKNLEYLSLTISNLQPSTSYYVRVIARNKYGEKNYTESVIGLTKDIESSSELPSPNIGMIVGATVGSVLILVIIAGVTVCLVRKGYRCIMVTPEIEAVRKRSQHDASRSVEDHETLSTTSGVNLARNQNPYSGLNRKGDRQIYTGLKTYVNIERGTDSAPNHEGFQENTPAPYENIKMHTYENTGALQTISPYESVETT